MQTQKPRLVALTSLRFFAAFWVVLYHTLPKVHNSLAYPLSIRNVLDSGFAAVSFFFVLSGFILAAVYLRASEPVETSRFYRARFARIYPLFVLTLLADTPVISIARASKYGLTAAFTKTSITFLANLAMLQAWFTVFLSIDAPNWSLSVETFFYLVFPWIGPQIWKLSRNVTLMIWFVAYASTLLFTFSATKFFAEDVVKFDPLMHINEFLLGIVLAQYWKFWDSDEISRTRFHQLGPRIFCLAVTTLVIAVQFRACVPFVWFNDGLLSPIFGLIILGAAVGKIGGLGWLSWTILEFLGEASFGLYLIHMVVWHYVEMAGLGHSFAFYPLYLALCLALSAGSFRVFEQPMRRWILGFRHPRPATAL